MSWLQNILDQARRIRKAECGSTLPENPTLADFKAEAFRIAQMAKEVQNSEHPYPDAQWRKISKAIEGLEQK